VESCGDLLKLEDLATTKSSTVLNLSSMLQRDYFQIADESAESALEGMLADDQNAIPREVLEAQIPLGDSGSH